MKKNGVVFLILFLILNFSAYSKISFGLSDINSNDEILFTARQNMAGINPYRSLFYAKIKNGAPEKQPEPLTLYPEQMELLENGTVLQVRNRYGIARYNAINESVEWTKLTKGMPVNSLPTIPYAVSPNGKWSCHMEKETLGSGKLILENTSSGKSLVLVDKVPYSYESIPVKWCSDSSIVIYEKNGILYFCNPDALMKGIEVEEQYRSIGKGTINSIFWASSRNIAYIDGYMLYRISSKELYTLGLYAGIIGRGKAIGRLPYKFDPEEDVFYTNSDVSAMMMVQKNTMFSYMTVHSQDCDYLDVVYSKPYMDSDASLIDSSVFWVKDTTPILWLRKLPYDGADVMASVYKIGEQAVKVLEIEEAGKPFVSPDGMKVAFNSGTAAYIYDVTNWDRLSSITGERILHLLWINKNSLYVGGAQTIRKWNLLSNTVETITLSTVATGYWNRVDDSILVDSENGTVYKYNKEKRTWKKQNTPPELTQITQNGRYRVFIGSTANKQFENALYIRTLSGKAVTKPVYAESVKKLPEPNKVALVFDLYDNTDGLANIISTLKKFNVPATFFVNGEFIRRYPAETKQIALNNYECGSMFFTTSDLTDPSFVMDEDFIRRGLARSEDEFYDCTGTELLLSWHAPYYKANDAIKLYGEKAGYNYVDVAKIYSSNKQYNETEELIQEYYDTIVENKGGFIPVMVGTGGKNRPEPLYKDLDLLICAIIDGNFEMVPVSQM